MDERGVMEHPSPKSSEAMYWRDMAMQSRLRIDNMRTMHRLRFLNASENWGALSSQASGPNVKSYSNSTFQCPFPLVNSGAPIYRAVPDNEALSTETENLEIGQTYDNPTNPFAQLPEDLLLSIFGYLSYPEIIACQRVCRAWRAYLSSERAFHRDVSFIHAKRPVPLRAIRWAISIAQNRIRSLEFDGRTLIYLTPFSTILPHLENLVIRQSTGWFSTIFLIMFRQLDGSFHQLPSLRTAIFQHGVLMSNEVVILLSCAQNLEVLECRSARICLDFLDLMDKSTQWKLQKLRIEHYSEQMTVSALEMEEPGTQTRVIRSPALLRFLPYLEELTFGIEALQVMDLTFNQRIRYLDFLPRSAIISFIQPPPTLKTCLNAPMLCRHLPDSYPTIWPPDSETIPVLHNGVQLWKNPPAFESLSISRVPSDIAVLPQALCNSCDSLVSLRINFALGIWSVRDMRSEELINQQMEQIPELISCFHNLRFLDVSESSYVGDTFLARTPALSLEYLCLARTSVTSRGVLGFLAKAKATLKEINVVDTDVGEEVRDVTAILSVKMETNYPGRLIQGV